MNQGFTSVRARSFAWVVICVCAGALVLGTILGLVRLNSLTESVRNTQIEGTPLGKQLLSSSERIIDCTSPEGQCFKDGQARTADAVGDINRVIVLAAACSVGLDPEWTVQRRQTAIQTCVIERLSRKP